MIKTLHLKVKKPYYKRLNKLAPEVNFVWNYINNLSYYMIRNYRRWLSAYDMHPYLVGASGEWLRIKHHTIQGVAEKYCTSRKTGKKKRIQFRGKKSLGWIPFSGDKISYRNGYFKYAKECKVKVFDSYGLENYKLRSGSFNQDSKGDWYLNIAVEVPEAPVSPKPTAEIGIDLGLKAFATLSNGLSTEKPLTLKKTKLKISAAQRANKKRSVKFLHKTLCRQNRDYLHKLSSSLVRENTLIVVGDIKSNSIGKKFKSQRFDGNPGWYTFKQMLEYKSIRSQVTFLKVGEYETSLTCNVCKNHTGPKGLEGLGIREWTCSSCGALHDRDVNAAINILALGRQSLAEGASC